MNSGGWAPGCEWSFSNKTGCPDATEHPVRDSGDLRHYQLTQLSDQ